MMQTSTVAVAAPLIDAIADLVDGIPGFTPADELFALATLVYATAGVPGDIVEIGSWCGRSSVVLAAAARDAGGVPVHCVDPFPARTDWQTNADGSYSYAVHHEGTTYRGYVDQTVWGDAFRGAVAPVYASAEGSLEVFGRNVASRGLSDVVRVHRGTVDTLVARMPEDFQVRLAFIDGDHGRDAVLNDIRRLRPYLSPGGWLCFDDAFSGYAGVDQAIAEAVLGTNDFDVARQLTRKLFVARRRPA